MKKKLRNLMLFTVLCTLFLACFGITAFAEKITLTFDPGKYGTLPVKTIEYEAGQSLGILPIPTIKDEYSEYFFVDWSSSTAAIDESSILYSSMTFKANYEERQEIPYTDVSKSDWYYKTARYCYDTGLITGTNGGKTFEPATNVTRGMIVSILYRVEGSPSIYEKSSFSDVPASSWYAKAVTWATREGIVTGYSNGTFRPDKAATREEVAIILHQYADYRAVANPEEAMMLIGFSDEGSVSSWALDHVSWAAGAGLITGKTKPNGEKLLCPKDTATRAEFGSMLMRLVIKLNSASEFYAGETFYIKVPSWWAGNLACYYYKTGDPGITICGRKLREVLGDGLGWVGSLCATRNTNYLYNFDKFKYIGVLTKSSYDYYHMVYSLPTDVQTTEDVFFRGNYVYQYLKNHLADIKVKNNYGYSFSEGKG